MNIQSPSIVKTVYSRIFQGHLGIFKDIDAYSVTLTRAQLRGGLPYPFSKSKKVPRLLKERL